MPYILIYFLCLLRRKFWADRYSKNDLTFLLCKVIYRCKKAGTRGRASSFEIFISSNCQRLLYSKEQKIHSINKASNGTRSYGKIVAKCSTKPIISRVSCLQQQLQNRVPRVQVLLPLPKRNSHRFGDCFFFVRQNLSSARACRASSPSAAGGRCSEARMAQRSKGVAKQLQVLP